MLSRPSTGKQSGTPTALCSWQRTQLFLGPLAFNNPSIWGFLFQSFVADKPRTSWVCRELRGRVTENGPSLRSSELGLRDITSSCGNGTDGIFEGPLDLLLFPSSFEFLLVLLMGRIQKGVRAGLRQSADQPLWVRGGMGGRAGVGEQGGVGAGA